MSQPVGIRSIAVSLPKEVIRNDYFLKNYPELLDPTKQASFSKAFTPLEDAEMNAWTKTMLPYVSDPFRGSIERRIISGDETSLTLEHNAALQAIQSASLTVKDVDLMIVSSMFPQHIIPGNAVFLAKKLNLECPAFNLDSSCAGALFAIEDAWLRVASGRYKNILVVASCTYSRFCKGEAFSMFSADGAGALIVGKLEANQGLIGAGIINTKESCGAVSADLTTDCEGQPVFMIRANKEAAKKMPELFTKYFRECCSSALENAEVTLKQIDFFIFYAATAWYVDFCVEELGIDPTKTINIYPHYTNISTASVVVALHHAAKLEKIHEGDLVLVYAHGFVGNAAALVIRWGKVALGPMPTPSPSFTNVPGAVMV